MSETATGSETGQPTAQEHALQELVALLPLVTELAEASESHRVRTAVNNLQLAVRGKVEDLSGDSPGRILLQWAHQHGIRGSNPFEIKGAIIKMSIGWMTQDAEAHYARATDVTLSLEDAKTAGYRAVKGCAVHFNPAVHGDDFQAFAEPFVIVAIQSSIETGHITVPDQMDLDALTQLQGTSTPVTRAAAKQPPQPTTAPPRAPREAKPKRPPKHAPPSTKSPANPPTAPTPPKAQTPEEVEEGKRQRRICRWAKDDLKLDVEQEQFERAVEAITEQFHSLANGVLNGLAIPSDMHGGKKALRTEARRVIPGFVREFEPPTGEHAPPEEGKPSAITVAFQQYLQGKLRLHLTEFIASKSKKK